MYAFTATHTDDFFTIKKCKNCTLNDSTKQGVYKSSLANFQEIFGTHLTKFQQDL